MSMNVPEAAMKRVVSDEQLDRIGRLADKADNYLSALTIPLSASFHVTGLSAGMQEIKAEAQALYRELGGTELDEE